MIAAIRGTQDILPGEVERWQFVEETACRVFEQYGYAEIRTPIIEREELFAKGTGETTDIVQKEMYAFTDKDGERITLRPEATPSLVRAFVEHSLEQAMAVPKIYTIGPMFRHERPQKGRYRQFHQLDVEVFGVKDPSVDGEVIDFAWTLIGALGITGVELAIELGRLPGVPARLRGGARCRARRGRGQAVRRLPAAGGDQPAPDLRLQGAGGPADHRRAAAHRGLPVRRVPGALRCRAAATSTCSAIPYTLSHRLVRGLDYYTRTTFEVLAGQHRRAESAVLGRRPLRRARQAPRRARSRGHRVRSRHRAARARPARDARAAVAPGRTCSSPRSATRRARRRFALLRDLRRAGLNAQLEYEGRSLKSQMKRADRLKAPLVLILGDDELARGEVTVRRMAASTQESVARAAVVEFARARKQA